MKLSENLSLHGTLSLDLDGTVVQSGHPMKKDLVDVLKHLQSMGMSILFNTGRNYSFASLALQMLDFPHFIAGQNGAVLVNGYNKTVIIQKNLPADFFYLFDEWEKKFELSFLVETGAQNKDETFYSTINVTKELREYFAYRQKIQKSKWSTVASWRDFDMGASMVKLFSDMDRLQKISFEIENSFKVSKMIIKDPFNEGQGILLINAEGVDKGSMLNDFLDRGLGARPCIAAGDDISDIPMLKNADIALASEHASQSIKDCADHQFTLDSIGSLLYQIATGERA